MPRFWAKTDAWANRLIAVGCVASSLFYLWTGFGTLVDRLTQMGVILMLALVTTFVKKPMFSKGTWFRPFDYFLALASVAIILQLIAQQNDPRNIFPPTDYRHPLMWFFVLVILEASRRVMGMGLTTLSLIFVLYGLFGQLLPIPFYHPPIQTNWLVWAAAYGQLGIFGLPLNTVATVIVFFIIFSSFLKWSGAGTAFVDLGFSLLGGFTGGAAKAAIASSALFGTISGSAVSNVATVGTFTIPLMKRTGYSSTMAAVVETLSSTGGMIMPPVMGSVAFIMADYIGVPYRSVAIAAIIPALLYYFSLFAVVHLEAIKNGLSGVPRSERPPLRASLVRVWPVAVVLGVVVYSLFVGTVTPQTAILRGLVALIVVGLLTKTGRDGLRHSWDALRDGSSDLTLIVIACAAAGVLISMMEVTNIGVELSGTLVTFAGGNPLVLLVLCMIASLVIGTGLSATAIYLTLAATVAPVLVQMGFPPLAAHLFILYYGVISVITPPVAVAAYTAAPIAGANPDTVGWKATYFGLIAYIIPFFFIYAPALLLQGTPLEVGVAVVTAVVGTFSFAAMLQGYLVAQTNLVQRVLLGVGGLMMIHPNVLITAIGAAMFISVLLWQIRVKSRSFAPPLSGTERAAMLTK